MTLCHAFRLAALALAPLALLTLFAPALAQDISGEYRILGYDNAGQQTYTGTTTLSRTTLTVQSSGVEQYGYRAVVGSDTFNGFALYDPTVGSLAFLFVAANGLTGIGNYRATPEGFRGPWAWNDGRGVQGTELWEPVSGRMQGFGGGGQAGGG